MVSLQKGNKINLKREDSSLKVLEVGLGWDTKTDLDSIAYLFDTTGALKKTIYYANKKFTGILQQ